MKKRKTIFDIKAGDPVWILFPGIVNRFNDGVVCFPKVCKTKVRRVSCVSKDEKGTSIVEVDKPAGSFPFSVPSSFYISHDVETPHFEMADEYVMYDDEPYLDDFGKGYIRISCIFDISTVKEEFKKASSAVEGPILNFVLREKKRLKSARKTIRDIKDNLTKTLGNLKK